MSALSFRHRAIAHLRDQLAAHTPMLPQTRIEDAQGNARFEAWLVDARIASNLNLASLYTFTGAAVVAFIGQRPMSAVGKDVCSYGALALVALATALLFMAVRTRRRARTPLAIEIRGDAIVDLAFLEAMRAEHGNRATWVFAAHGFTSEARAGAASLQMRLFAPRGDTVIECLPVAGHPEEQAA